MKTTFLGFLLILSGCTVYRPGAPMTSINLGPKEDAIASAKGESFAHGFLCNPYWVSLCMIGPFGENSTTAAIEDAKKSVGADAIVNAVVESKIFFFPFIYTRATTIVSGTAIKYKDSPNFRAPAPAAAGRDPGAPTLSEYERYRQKVTAANRRRQEFGQPLQDVKSFEEWSFEEVEKWK